MATKEKINIRAKVYAGQDLQLTTANAKEVGALTVPSTVYPLEEDIILPITRIRTHQDKTKTYFVVYGPLDRSKFPRIDWDADDNSEFTKWFLIEGQNFDWVDDNGNVIHGSDRNGFEGVVNKWGNGSTVDGDKGVEKYNPIWDFIKKYWIYILLAIVFRKSISEAFKTVNRGRQSVVQTYRKYKK